MRETSTSRRPLVAAVVATFGFAVVATLGLAQPKSAPQSPPAPVVAPGGAPEAQIQRGEYLVKLGDCVACHTQQGGQRFAGGRPLQTPFGTVLSANLTPDKDTGIGRYDAEKFYRALHEGVDAEGRHLYPAFPYNYYTNVSRDDSDAMFAYLRSIPAVNNPLERNRLPFPFSIRQLMIVWNWMFLDKGPYQADASRSAEWNRGAYLVEGLGHCQACHTPKNLLGGPKKDEAFRGGVFGDWFAPDITPNRRTGIGAWDRDALLEFLRAGRNIHSAASGEMGEVVAFSSSQMSDADLSAVLAYLASQPASPDLPSAAPEPAVMKQGQAIFVDECAACHRADGQGVPRFFPPLKGNANVQQRDPTTVLHFILAGARHVPTERAPTPLSMPAFNWKLDDAQVAAVATFVRNSWGNAAAPVQVDQVAKLRERLPAGRGRPENVPATGMDRPGVNTMAPAGTDSRDNGTDRAGRAAPQTQTQTQSSQALGSAPPATGQNAPNAAQGRGASTSTGAGGDTGDGPTAAPAPEQKRPAAAPN